MTVDFWGTLLLDPPSSDNRYKRRRMADFELILGGLGLKVTPVALERAYEDSAGFLGRTWVKNRDVPVTEHVRAILAAVDPGLPGLLPAEAMTALVDAYARPALLVPPSVDPGARAALTRLQAQGLTLALLSNTMRTPGVVLRQVLDRFGLLACFAHTTFSDEVGVRKPGPEIFAATLRAIQVDAAAAVHVGDDAILDVAGARQAGLRVIQVTGAAPSASGAPRPDAVIPSLAGLPEAIARLDHD